MARSASHQAWSVAALECSAPTHPHISEHTPEHTPPPARIASSAPLSISRRDDPIASPGRAQVSVPAETSHAPCARETTLGITPAVLVTGPEKIGIGGPPRAGSARGFTARRSQPDVLEPEAPLARRQPARNPTGPKYLERGPPPLDATTSFSYHTSLPPPRLARPGCAV